MKILGIVGGHPPHLKYIGMHESKEACWQIFLGYPSADEIFEYRQKHQAVCLELVAVDKTFIYDVSPNPQGPNR